VEDCLFCRIVSGDVEADVVHETERTLAFRAGDPEASAELLTAAADVAKAEGHDDYRLVFNTGPGSGQTVFHTHLHLLAGRSFSWPPG
jgi:histidine triad (HIT) family protein